MAVPFIGGIGATLVCYTLNCRPSAKINGAGSSTFFIKGFISGLAGLLTYYCPRNIISQQAGFCIIVLIWQFIIGFQALKHAEIRNAENIGQDKKTPKNIDPDNIYSGKSETFRKWVIKKRF